MKFIEQGVCAPIGFYASGMNCGIRKNKTKNDLTLIYSEKMANAAAVYTQNIVKGAPLVVTKNNIKDGYAQAIICNSGNANTCNANGEEIATMTCELLANQIGLKAEDIVVASTGVIGQELDITPIKNGIETLVSLKSKDGNDAACEGIMTTDTIQKSVAIEFNIGDKVCKMGGIAKGSGMIHPDMATMLVFLTTDCKITSKMLQKALSHDITETFNMVSVDGDTSTNDMVCILANGMAENIEINEDGEDFKIFMKAINTVNMQLCKLIAGDGEGATKLVECEILKADNVEQAKLIAKSVICSSLVKTAMFGADANWGRILCAIGYSKAKVDYQKIDVYFESIKGKIQVCSKGASMYFSEEKAKEILLEDEITIIIDLNIGSETTKAWGCDLTYDYVKINGDYRT